MNEHYINKKPGAITLKLECEHAGLCFPVSNLFFPVDFFRDLLIASVGMSVNCVNDTLAVFNALRSVFSPSACLICTFDAIYW